MLANLIQQQIKKDNTLQTSGIYPKNAARHKLCKRIYKKAIKSNKF